MTYREQLVQSFEEEYADFQELLSRLSFADKQYAHELWEMDYEVKDIEKAIIKSGSFFSLIS